MSEATWQLLENLNALAAGLFLLTAFGIVAMRQIKACLNLFILQSLLLAASAALLGLRYDSVHLYGVALVNLISKPVIVPWLLRKTRTRACCSSGPTPRSSALPRSRVSWAYR